MRLGNMALAILSCLALRATIIDRIAIVVGDRIIKDSDIERDIRVVDFLNQQKLDLSLAARRKAADRLIDQAIIQRELQVGEYQTASESDAAKLYTQTEKDHAPSPAAFNRELASYGLTGEQLKRYLLWQLTVLRFIDQRFRPAILISDDDVEQYYRDHSSEFRQTNSSQPKSLDEVRDQIKESLTEDRINKQFYAWLAARIKNLTIEYREEALK
jgi:peptidyl-prolyl cis-trans isomerase SurA